MLLSQELDRIYNADSGPITFGQFLNRIDEKSYGVLLAIIAMPSIIPGPPGYPTIFGVPCAILAWQYLIGRESPWFPKKILHRKIAGGKNKNRFLPFARGVARFIERFLKGRLDFVYRARPWRLALGIMMLLCATSMVLPIPLGNSVPALAIVLIALGMLEEDGLVGLVGMVVGLVGVAISCAVVYVLARFGWDGVRAIEDWLRGLFLSR